MVFTRDSIEKVKSVLSVPRKVCIIGHKSPDGDAIGSSMALKMVLEDQHDVKVIMPDEFPSFLNWIKGTEEILFDSKGESAAKAIEECDVVFTLDFNNPSRVSDRLAKAITGSSAFKIMIDHHREPDDYCDVTFSDISSCSTCQMVYQFSEAMGLVDRIKRDAAEAIYCGIMTDTGSFKFSSTTSETHRIVADLIEKGAENTKIHQIVYDSNSIDRVKLLGYALNKMEVYPESKVAILSLSIEEMHRFNCQKGDTEGFVNFALSMTGIEVAAFFKETPELIKISFRSKGDYHVNELSRDHFNGGGHKNAAGGAFHGSLQEGISKLKELFDKLESYNHG